MSLYTCRSFSNVCTLTPIGLGMPAVVFLFVRTRLRVFCFFFVSCLLFVFFLRLTHAAEQQRRMVATKVTTVNCMIRGGRRNEAGGFGKLSGRGWKRVSGRESLPWRRCSTVCARLVVQRIRWELRPEGEGGCCLITRVMVLHGEHTLLSPSRARFFSEVRRRSFYATGSPQLL